MSFRDLQNYTTRKLALWIDKDGNGFRDLQNYTTRKR